MVSQFLRFSPISRLGADIVKAMSFIAPNSQPPPGTKTPVRGTVKLTQPVRRTGDEYLITPSWQPSFRVIRDS